MINKRIAVVFAVCSLILAGCTSNTDISNLENGSLIEEQKIMSEINLYNEFVDKNKNWMFSPYSLKDAFSLLYNGTSGITKTEFETVLNLNDDEIHKIRNYDGSIKRTEDSIKIANRAYITNNSSLRNKLNIDALKITEDMVRDLNVSNPEEAANEINSFVSETTNNKINDFIDPGSINQDSVLYLVNALYFNKSWDFNEGTIRWSDGKVYKAFQDKDYSLYKIKEVDNGNIDVLRLDYEKEDNENNYAMTIFCKSANAEKNNVDSYLKTITQENFNKILDFETYQGLDGYSKAVFSVPNFEFENKFSLKDDLKQVGMKETFSSNKGFDKIGPIQISDVIQATYIKTDSKGTEAAAATGIGMKMSANIETGKTKIVAANDDFVFVISDTTTNTVLFMGRVNQPTTEN